MQANFFIVSAPQLCYIVAYCIVWVVLNINFVLNVTMTSLNLLAAVKIEVIKIELLFSGIMWKMTKIFENNDFPFLFRFKMGQSLDSS